MNYDWRNYLIWLMNGDRWSKWQAVWQEQQERIANGSTIQEKDHA